jgi:hypothetical protein
MGVNFWISPENLFFLLEFRWQFRNFGYMGTKQSQISALAQEASYFLFIFKGRPYPYGLQLLRVRGYPFRYHNMVYVLYFFLKQLAGLQIKFYADFSEPLAQIREAE